MSSSDQDVILGVDVGGTKLKVMAFAGMGSDDFGAELYEKTVPAEANSALPLIRRVSALVRDAINGLPVNHHVRAIGVGAAGVIDRGCVADATSLLPGWKGTDIQGILATQFAVPVVALNDVHAAATSESVLGAGREYRSVLHVMVGTGIGGAITIDGVVQHGSAGICGSIGHMPSRLTTHTICTCGGIDHIEVHASGSGIEREYAKFIAPSEPMNVKDIAECARGGDIVARAFLEERFAALGEVIGGAVNLIDTDVVIIGGGVANLGDQFMQPVKAGIQSSALPIRRDIPVVRASKNNQQVSIGAAIAARKAAFLS